MPRLRHVAAMLAGATLIAAPALAQSGTPEPTPPPAPAPPPAQPPIPAPDRPAGLVFSWGHELNQEELPNWNPRRPPIPEARWYRTIDEILRTAGRNGLWFSGFAALPFDIPVHPNEPSRWRNHSVFLREYRRTGLSWDVNVEARAAKNALARRDAVVANPQAKAPTRRLSLLDPAYRRAALAEIRRIVPRLARAPYVAYYTGSDEPFAALPRGRRALASPFARRLAREVRAEFGQALPKPDGRPRPTVAEGLRWLAYSRYASDRFFDMKAEQARLIRRLDPDAVISPNDYGFIDGFLPWDYTRLADFADVVEADPYVSFPERQTPGRGRYNPGFTAKLLSDLTGKRIRIVIQAFLYAGYRPVPADLRTWTAQALRAGATDISFYALGNPRFTNRRLYDAMLDIASRLRGSRLPAKPEDPRTVVVYATASEGQAQPHRSGDARYRTSADGLYTTHSLLWELAGAPFTFDADTRIARDPQRLAGAQVVWLPRGETLDRPFAQALVEWVKGGGTLVVTDPDAFTREPSGAPLDDVRAELIGAPLGGRRAGEVMTIEPDALGPGLPADLLTIPLDASERRAFAAIPEGATVVGRFIDDAPAAISRPVGAGRVIAFATDVMVPAALDEPLDLVRMVEAIQSTRGLPLEHPAHDYRVPGDRDPDRLPWEGAAEPD